MNWLIACVEWFHGCFPGGDLWFRRVLVSFQSDFEIDARDWLKLLNNEIRNRVN